MQSQHAHIDWAAAKRIVVSVAGGASMTMEGGNITFECPGTITVKAGKKSFVGPERLSYAVPKLPRWGMKPQWLDLSLTLRRGPAGHGARMAHAPWRLVRANGASKDRIIVQGESGADGGIALSTMQKARLAVAAARWPDDLMLVAPGMARPWRIEQALSDWGPAEQSHHALAAMDHSDDPVACDQDARGHRRLASAALSVPAGANFKQRMS